MTREDNRVLFGAHPDVKLWFKVAAGQRTATVEVKLSPSAYMDVSPQDASDGIELQWWENTASGEVQPLFSHYINPRDVPEHRGIQTITTLVDLGEGSTLEMRITPGPNGSYSRDWASLSLVRIE